MRSVIQKPIVDPDPLTIVLTILGALGSVASLISLAEQHRNDATRAKENAAEKILSAVDDADRALQTLASSVRSLEFLTFVGTRYMMPFDTAKLPLRFGSVRLFLPEKELAQWRRLITRSANANARLQRSITDLLSYFASSDYKLSPHLVRQISAMQGSLNSLLASLGSDASIGILSELYVATIEARHNLSALKLELSSFFDR